MLKAGGSEQPLVLQVGSRVMFAAGAYSEIRFLRGPDRSRLGLQLLKKVLRRRPKNKLIVIYCGCCPWNHCPNIGPHLSGCMTLDSRT